MKVRAKFRVQSVTQTDNTPARNIKLSATYDASVPEDQRYATATPYGEITLYVNNPVAVDQFVVGESFYVDFMPVGEANA